MAGARWRRSTAPAWWVLLGMLAVMALAAIAPLPVRGVLTLVTAAIGIAALVVGVLWHRPVPATGWWLLLVGVATSVAGVVVVYVVAGLPTEDAPLPGFAPQPVPWSDALFTTSYLVIVGGLALVGRLGGRTTGWLDLLDSMVVVAATFPLLWILVIHPMLEVGGVPYLIVVLAPVSLVLLLALAVKLVFSVGMQWSAGWLLVAALGLVGTNIGVVVPVVTDTAVVMPVALVPFLWVLFPAGLGLGGLHPSIVATTAPLPRPDRPLSVARLVLLGVLALLIPVAFLLADLVGGYRWLHDEADVVALIGPVVVVALLLVVRLAIVARLAQRRSMALARQAYTLDVALREQETLRQQLTYRALHDPLTGLANRVVLAERLEWALTRPGGTGRHALLLLDLDGFKDVNDTLGHQVGDELLIATAHRVLAQVPAGGMLARLGGDELAALLEEVDAEAAGAWAEQVLRAMRRPFEIAGRRLYQTTSIGLALLDATDGQTTASSALRDADLALCSAKAAGKDRVVQFAPAMAEERLTHSRLSAGLRRALVNDELRLEYQPVVDLATGQVWAVEALLRWRQPGGEEVSPEEFIPVAEETGMIIEIGGWVLRRACAQARSWYATRQVAVAVNVSARQLVDSGFADTVLAALAAADLPGEGMIIEITETSMIATANVGSVVAQLGRLREHGVRVAIDDFGTGYSSLSYLARLPVDILKIDSSFTRRGDQPTFGPEDWPFTRAILELGEGLQLTTVAEGIETSEQADALRQLRCQLAQGYLFSRPVPPDAIDELLSMPVSVHPGSRPAS